MSFQKPWALKRAGGLHSRRFDVLESHRRLGKVDATPLTLSDLLLQIGPHTDAQL